MSSVTLARDDFGSYTDSDGNVHEVSRFTWTNGKAIVQVINYGATIISVKMPDKNGNVVDLVAGFDTIEEYRASGNYYGATVGRVANRIAKGHFTVDGVEYTLAINDSPNSLHGGLVGFDKRMWNYRINGTQLVLTYHSADMEEGFPGDLIATITYELTAANEFKVHYKAVVTKGCPINLINHSYINLGGHGSGAEEIYKHVITLNADQYTPVDDTQIPTGQLVNVANTVFDFRIPKVLGDTIDNVPNSNGYDFNYVINKSSSSGLPLAGSAYHPSSGRFLQVYTNQPGVQFFTANNLPTDDSSQGKGAVYKFHGFVCFETQNYPDAVNHPNFPKSVYYPGEEYDFTTIYKFSIRN